MKMRHVFLLLTGVFWMGVGYYALTAKAVRPGAPAVLEVKPGAGPRVARKPNLPTIGAAELARHSTPGDCWIVIAGTVYDLTGYVDLHPSKHQEMEQFCGKDGTRPWDVKDSGKERGQPHTRRSVEFLEEYPQMGVLEP